MKRSCWKFNFVSRESVKRTRQLAVPRWTDVGTRLTYNFTLYNRGSTACPVWLSLMRRNVKWRILVQILEVAFVKEKFSNNWYSFLESGNNLNKFVFRKRKIKFVAKKPIKLVANNEILAGRIHKAAFIVFFIKSIVGILERLSLRSGDEFNSVLNLFNFTKHFFFF